MKLSIRKMNATATVTMAFLIGALALGCATSTGRKDDDNDDSGADADTDTDSDTDTDTDGDTDTDTDSDTNECACSDPLQPCCQDDGCTLEEEGVVCDETYIKEYSCQDEDPDCGSSVYVRYKQRLCDGESFVCFGEVTDWGDWQVATTCKSFQRCSEEVDGGVVDDGSDAGIAGGYCVSDPSTCPVEFGQRVCFKGQTLEDCPSTGCPDPLPSITESQAFSDVSGGTAGEVVLLEVSTLPRESSGYYYPLPEPKPFTDIHAVLRHNGTELSFYNNYQSYYTNDWYGNSWTFRKDWPVPNFWGEDMSGTWELYIEDNGFSGVSESDDPVPFEVIEWCLTFEDPEVTEFETTDKEWKIEYPTTAGSIAMGVNYYEGQITDLVRADEEAPVEHLNIVHDSPKSLAIDLVVADGQVITLKAMGTETIPEDIVLDQLVGKWITGRYQLKITSEVSNTGGQNRVNSWGVSIGKPDDADGGVDGGKAAEE